MTHFKVYKESDGWRPVCNIVADDSIAAQDKLIKMLKEEGVTDPIVKNGFSRVVTKSGDGPYDYKDIYYIDYL